MLGLALALRVVCAWLVSGPDAAPGFEPAIYDAVAWNLAQGAGFSLDSAAGPYPTAGVPPLVPWLTSLLYRAVGHRYFAAVLLQCVIGALVPLVLAALGGALFSGALGRWSGWLAAVHPLLVLFSGSLLATTACGLTLLLALWLSAEWVRAPRGGRALGTGLAWGVATLSHPSALLLPLVVAAWGWRPLGLTLGGRARLRQLGLLMLGLMLAVGPWTLRNGLALGTFIPVTTGAGRALLAANNPAAWNAPAVRGGDDSGSRQAELRGEFAGSSEVEADARAGRQAWAFVRGRLHDWPQVAVARLARFWRPGAERHDTAGWRRPARPLALPRGLDPLLAWSVVTLPLALWGAMRALRGGRCWFQSLPLLVVPYYMVVAVVFSRSLRTRVPVEPLVVLLVALGLEDARRVWRARRRRLTVVPGRRAGGSPAKP